MNAGRWMWTDDWKPQDADDVRLVCFRAEIDFDTVPDTFCLHCSADTRYKLYVNGQLIQFGPAKGDDHVHYYDRVDVAPWLKSGVNALAFEVLRYPLERYNSNHSLFRTEQPGLYVKCDQPLRWRCHVCRGVRFYAEEEGFAPLHFHEKVRADASLAGWTLPGYDDGAWTDAIPLDRIPDVLLPERLTERPIPFMSRKPGAFWNWAAPVDVPANATKTWVLDAGEEMTGFIRMELTGGAGAKIELLYSECYVIPTAGGFEKRRRDDSVNGVLTGYADAYTVAGYGTAEVPEVYSPYWFRTFRYVRVTVRAGIVPVTVQSLSYEETGYPLEVKTHVETSDPTFAAIWDISLRSLRCCMQETYVDCPFYEQMQYAMDTRSQILYTYAVSADDRLARNAIDDFARSQRLDGLLNCSYPNVNEHVIPGFSIYYILMVYDHMMYFGDVGLVKRYLPVIDRTLDYFAAHLTEGGLVDKLGGVLLKAPFWSFIDWAKEWMPTSGMPAAGLNGPITMESLLYVLGLQHAAMLAEYVEEEKKARNYRARAIAVQKAIRQFCMTPESMIADGPGSTDISQHGQVFGILTDTLTAEEGRRGLLATVRNPAIPQCTVAMCFYLFRALEKTGLYEYTDQYWNIWRRMVENGCTTCVEAEVYARSECHGWGALALYELPSVALGVRPAAPGYGKIRVKPVPGKLTRAEGVVHTPRGDIGVKWTLKNGKPDVQIDCDDALKRDIITETED